MDCGLVMLIIGGIDVRGKKCDCRGNVRASTSRQLIDASKNTLIYLFSTRKIGIERVNGRNGIDWEPGTIRSHVGNFVGSVNREPMSSKFSECQLA